MWDRIFLNGSKLRKLWCGVHIRIYHECEFGTGKSVLRIIIWHDQACRVMTVIASDIFFYPILTLFSFSPLNSQYSLYLKTVPWNSQIHWDATRLLPQHKDGVIYLLTCSCLILSFPHVWPDLVPNCLQKLSADIIEDFLPFSRGRISAPFPK